MEGFLIKNILYAAYDIFLSVQPFDHVGAKDAIVMKILHDDSIFNIFMLSGGISRDEMNEALREQGIPITVSVEAYEELLKHWIYKLL